MNSVISGACRLCHTLHGCARVSGGSADPLHSQADIQPSSARKCLVWPRQSRPCLPPPPFLGAGPVLWQDSYYPLPPPLRCTAYIPPPSPVQAEFTRGTERASCQTHMRRKPQVSRHFAPACSSHMSSAAPPSNPSLNVQTSHVCVL